VINFLTDFLWVFFGVNSLLRLLYHAICLFMHSYSQLAHYLMHYFKWLFAGNTHFSVTSLLLYDCKYVSLYNFVALHLLP